MKILEFPIERTPAGKVDRLIRQLEVLLQEKRVVGVLFEQADQLATVRRELCAHPDDIFRRDQVRPLR